MLPQLQQTLWPPHCQTWELYPQLLLLPPLRHLFEKSVIQVSHLNNLETIFKNFVKFEDELFLDLTFVIPQQLLLLLGFTKQGNPSFFLILNKLAKWKLFVLVIYNIQYILKLILYFSMNSSVSSLSVPNSEDLTTGRPACLSVFVHSYLLLATLKYIFHNY